MHLAHRALVQSEPGTATVTSIAMANGFWELGRFAVEYRTLFGEPPRRHFAVRRRKYARPKTARSPLQVPNIHKFTKEPAMAANKCCQNPISKNRR
jgi:hypothetical protein